MTILKVRDTAKMIPARVVTADDVLRDLGILARAHPNWVNPIDPETEGCLYDDRKGCHCLIGQYMLDVHGVHIGDRNEDKIDSILQDYHWGVTNDITGEKGLIRFTDRAVAYLTTAQELADSGGYDSGTLPWGKAYARFLDAVKNVLI